MGSNMHLLEHKILKILAIIIFISLTISTAIQCISSSDMKKQRISSNKFKIIEHKKGTKELNQTKFKSNTETNTILTPNDNRVIQNTNPISNLIPQKLDSLKSTDNITNTDTSHDQTPLHSSTSTNSIPDTQVIKTPQEEQYTQPTCIFKHPYFTNLQPPLLINDLKIMVTKFFSPCIGTDGSRGFMSNSAWSTMGIPCSGGNGKIDWKGFSYNPKMIIFYLSLNCPMAPTTEIVKNYIGRKVLGLMPSAKLISYTPLLVQYWELDDFSEANVGSNIELRTSHNIKVTWENIKKGAGLKVKIFGRENSWSQDDYFYMALIEIFQTGFKSFKVNVLDFKVLNAIEIAQVKSRCLSLKPPRKCNEVFD